MTRTHAYQMTAAACCLAVLLAGCATTNGPVPMPQAPAPVETPDVKTVKAMVLPIDDTVTVAVAGLVAITPASGFVEPAPALFIGLVAGVLCFWMVAVVKAKLGYDDSLDAFGVHGIGGMLGAVLTGFFATSAVTGSELPPMMTQVGIQIFSVAATLIYGGIVSFVILFVIKKTMGLRVTKDEELTGLDLAIHGERIE